MIPTIPVGGTQASVILIAHKASKIIKSFWRGKNRLHISENKFIIPPEKFSSVLSTTPSLELRNLTSGTDVITRIMKLQLPKIHGNTANRPNSNNFLFSWKPIPVSKSNVTQISKQNDKEQQSSAGNFVNGKEMLGVAIPGSITNQQEIASIPIMGSMQFPDVFDNFIAESKTQELTAPPVEVSNHSAVLNNTLTSISDNNNNTTSTPTTVPIFYLVRKPKDPAMIGDIKLRPSPPVSIFPGNGPIPWPGMPTHPMNFPGYYGHQNFRPGRPYRKRRPNFGTLFRSIFQNPRQPMRLPF